MHKLNKQQEQRLDNFIYASFDTADDDCHYLKKSFYYHLADEIALVVKEERERIINKIKIMPTVTHTPVGGYSNIKWIEKNELLEKLKQERE